MLSRRNSTIVIWAACFAAMLPVPRAQCEVPKLPEQGRPVAFALVGTEYRLTILAKLSREQASARYVRREMKLETAGESRRVLATWDAGTFRWDGREFADRILGSLVVAPDWIYLAFCVGDRAGFAVLRQRVGGSEWTVSVELPVFEQMLSGRTTIVKAFQVVFSDVNPQTGAATAELYALARPEDTAVQRVVFHHVPDVPEGRQSWKPDPPFDNLLFGDAP